MAADQGQHRLLVSSQGTQTATSRSDVATGGAFTGGVALPSAHVDGGVKAELDASVSKANTITVQSIANRTAAATSSAISVGLGAFHGGAADATISSSANTDAIVGAGSSMNATGAIISVTSSSTNEADAAAPGLALGAITASFFFPSAEDDATTSAQFLGNIGGTHIDPDGTKIGDAGAAQLTVHATGTDQAVAKVDTTAGALLGTVSAPP